MFYLGFGLVTLALIGGDLVSDLQRFTGRTAHGWDFTASVAIGIWFALAIVRGLRDKGETR